jgi:hypothetical protein
MKEFGKRKERAVQEPHWLAEQRAREAEEKKRQHRRIKNRIAGVATALAVIALLSLPETRQGIVWLADQAIPQVLASF